MNKIKGKGTKTPGPLTISFTLQQLEAVGDRLHDRHRVVLRRLIVGVSYKQAATDLNISVGTLKSRSSRARAALKKLLEADKTNAAIGKAISEGALA